MNKEIRFKQRFENFQRSYQLLSHAVDNKQTSDIERAGLIQFFEMTFELSWKTLKDYLESQGFDLKTPKEIFKQAFQTGIIKDGHAWMEALEDRNLMTHTYNEQMSLKVVGLIKEKYYPCIKQLYEYLSVKATL